MLAALPREASDRVRLGGAGDPKANVRDQPGGNARPPKRAGDGRCVKGRQARSHRDMAIRHGQTTGRVVAAPAATGEIHLRPGVQSMVRLGRFTFLVTADEA